MLRRVLGTAIVALAFGALTGCATEPEPAWTEDEAYAAAEEVFREFWDVSNENDSDFDPSLYATGDLLDLYSTEDGVNDGIDDLEWQGSAEIVDFSPTDFKLVGDSAALSARSCIDASTLRIRQPGGDWTKPRDESYYGVKLSFVSVKGTMLISNLDEARDMTCEP